MIVIEQSINKQKMTEAYKNTRDKFEILIPDGKSNLEYITQVETGTNLNFRVASMLGVVDLLFVPAYLFLLYSALTENRLVEMILVAVLSIRFFVQSNTIYNLRNMMITNEWERHMNHIKSFLIKSSMKMMLTGQPKIDGEEKEYLTEEEFSGIIEKSERMTNTLLNYTTASIIELTNKDKKV